MRQRKLFDFLYIKEYTHYVYLWGGLCPPVYQTQRKERTSHAGAGRLAVDCRSRKTPNKAPVSDDAKAPPGGALLFFILETATGYQKHDLKPGEAPEASFAVTEPVIAAYEYCNLHGLWMVKA